MLLTYELPSFSSPVIDSCAGQIFSLVDAKKPAIRQRSSVEPHSLVTRSAPCGHVSWCLSAYFGQEWRTWSGGWSACLHSHREVSEMPILLRWALRPHCPVRRRKIVVCWARSSFQIGSRCAWYPPFSFFHTLWTQEWRSALASLSVTGFCVSRAWLPIFASLSALLFLVSSTGGILNTELSA